MSHLDLNRDRLPYPEPILTHDQWQSLVTESVKKLGASFVVSAEQMHGPREWTAEDERRHQVWQAKRAALIPRFKAALAAIEQVDEPYAAAVLKLHALDYDYSYPCCRGCDYSGYEGEPPSWPCSTVDLLADELQLDWPNWGNCDWDLMRGATP